MLDLVFVEKRSKMLNKVKTKSLISVGVVAATRFILCNLGSNQTSKTALLSGFHVSISSTTPKFELHGQRQIHHLI